MQTLYRKVQHGGVLEGPQVANSGECINCFHCVDVCPRRNLTANPTPVVTGAAAAVAITGLYYAGAVSEDKMSIDDNAVMSAVEVSPERGTYLDGVYTGEGEGFRGPVNVQVSVENGTISDIEVTSFQDDPDFFTKAQNSIIREILSSQSAEADTVSGATISSNGIIAAVKDAMGQAENQLGNDLPGEEQPEQKGPEQPEEEQTDQTGQEPSGEEQPEQSNQHNQGGDMVENAGGEPNEAEGAPNLEAFDVSGLADGVYTGTGNGFRGEVKVSVTVASGKITDITIDSHQDDESFFGRAEESLTERILGEQSLEVDTVSGATYSSNGILEAISNALNVPYDNSGIENSQSDQVQGSGEGQGRGNGEVQGSGEGQGRGNGQGNGRRVRNRSGRQRGNGGS